MRGLLLLLVAGCASGHELFECPHWLGALCDPVCIMQHCGTVMKNCMSNQDCRSSLTHFMECASFHNRSNFTQQTSCMIPDNAQRDGVFNCMIEEHRCIKLPNGSSPVYPTCRDAEIKGDPEASLQQISSGGGEWYKVHSWRLGEPVECMDCQRLRFSLDGSDALRFNSTWWEADIKGKLWLVDVVATMSLDASRGPAKLFNTGEMFGLTYWEPYTIVKDGSLETEPFVFFYVCGGTLQGNYTTAFAIAKTPHLTPSLHTRLAGIAESIGLNDNDFCTVNNTCFDNK